MPGYCRLIGNRYIITNLGVMPDMHKRHQQRAIAHPGNFIFKRRTVNGYIFADNSIFTDFRKAPQTGFETVILRFGTDQRAKINTRIFADGSVFADLGMCVYPAVIADNAVVFHHCIGADFHIFADYCPRRNGCCRVDRHYFTTVPAAVSPISTRSRLPLSKKLKTTIGRSCSRHKLNAAASMTLSCLLKASS